MDVGQELAELGDDDRPADAERAEGGARQYRVADPLVPAPAISADAQLVSRETWPAPEADPPHSADVPMAVQPKVQHIRLTQLIQHSLPLSFGPVFFARRKRRTNLVSALLVIVVSAGMLYSTGASGAALAGLTSKTLCLATDFPTSGTADSPQMLGKPVENAVNLAVQQHKDLGSGYTLQVINYNDVSSAADGHDPATGAKNVQQMVQNPCIVGMVGPFNSSVALAELPIAARAGLVMISPSTTNPSLTLRTYAQAQGSIDRRRAVARREPLGVTPGGEALVA